MSMSCSVPNYTAPWRQLRDRVDRGTLRLTLITGLPRGGTTAAERHIGEALSFDGNVNQPAMFERLPPGESRDRSGETWGRVLERVECLEGRVQRQGRCLQRQPLQVIVKETVHLIEPRAEMRSWESLVDSVWLSIRTPPLQLESIIRLILDRVASGALRDLLGIDEGVDPRQMNIHGSPLFLVGSDWSHLDPHADIPLWTQHVRWMVEHRDYRSLGHGFVRLAILHPSLEEPELQSAVWRMFHDAQVGSSRVRADAIARGRGCVDLRDLIDQHLGTRLEHFDRLPAILVDALYRWRMAWWPLRAHLQRRSVARCTRIFDFSDLRARPAGYFEAIRAQVTHGGVPLGGSGFDFDICSRGPRWDVWYRGPDYRNVLSRRTLTPPDKAPLLAAALPSCVRRLLPSAFATYLMARADPRFLTLPRDCVAASGVDPLQDYIEDSLAGSAEGGRVTRARAPQYEPYFREVDALLAQPGWRRQPGRSVLHLQPGGSS